MNTLENTIVRRLRDKPFYGHFLLNLRRSEQRPEEASGGGSTTWSL